MLNQAQPNNKPETGHLCIFPFYFFNWPLLRPGSSGVWAALHGNCIAMTTHFMGQKNNNNKCKRNTMELIGERVDDRKHKMLPSVSLHGSLCVSLSPKLRYCEDFFFFLHARLLNHSLRLPVLLILLSANGFCRRMRDIVDLFCEYDSCVEIQVLRHI